MAAASGFYYLLTFTAPGAAAHCMKPGCGGQGDGVGCRHKRCRCTAEGGVSLAEWNALHGKRWNRLLTSIKREYPGFTFMRGCEVQDGKRRKDGKGRGALHDHCICNSPVPLDVKVLRDLAVRAGFGHSVDLELVSPTSRRAAEYVSKYVSKSVAERAAVPWIRIRPSGRPVLMPAGVLWDSDDGYCVQLHDDGGDEWTAWTPVKVSADATFRSWSKSRSWGLTMQQVKAAGREYAVRMEAAREAAEAPALAPESHVPVHDLVAGVYGDYVRVWTVPAAADDP